MLANPRAQPLPFLYRFTGELLYSMAQVTWLAISTSSVYLVKTTAQLSRVMSSTASGLWADVCHLRAAPSPASPDLSK